MTRSVKDLRELICVSRLTMRDSDEEDDDLSRPLSSLSIFGENSPSSSVTQLGESVNDLSVAPRPPLEGKALKSRSQHPAGARPKQSPATKHVANVNNNASLDFKKFKTPLPPLESRPSSGSSVDSDRPGSGEVGGQDSQRGDFDGLLQYIDGEVIVDWLRRAHEMVDELSSWCNTRDNFVTFANFLLMDFAEVQRLELLKMEVGILHDELSQVFNQGVSQGKVTLTDLSRLVAAILREYPRRLCGPRGTHVFLSILDTLSSERTAEYKTLLTDVKISTRNREFAQSLLAIRAFFLLSVWSNVVNFYRRFQSDDPLREPCLSGDPVVKPLPVVSIVQQRAYQAVQYGFVSVLHYLVRSGKLDVDSVNKDDRSLVFEAVMHNQPKVLHYLLSKAQPGLDVNRPSDSGNTPLHAAANWGYAEVVHMLLDKARASVNAPNPKCDDATPLHLAVMQGHTAVCKLLLEAGADPNASMNGISPAQLAQDMGHGDILVLLRKRRGTYDYEEMVDDDSEGLMES
ncbi:uncharacterized protein LOC110981841 [Acanthaster planci]|uniref:Uncharacterized protein LOC110981841 n=1 Tax=Acanthaster planci TaxID=133434 RepID=A0A8B7YSQ6_ACAPL|nr:uncharacterized protein LOC110981841 [Acanthaster planci]XP_022095499.1 uncharacterized protein LOC110981841 [Acanthaster planci]XP_022095500.1 uncharacterized protein LOC110981841 [Acanthaster planci]XP_022095501.1 uncharacterized protein LOC110981841 [Acanthaster planci]XP_022095502.1 uncharacterized protein LOC110981841 [Acanthaster planci]XP_022095503.1 uncharacterized protein LOC110981841 [Acanthaster planci]